MVGDVLGVRRADADVDQRDAAVAIAARQMIAGHLVTVPLRASHDKCCFRIRHATGNAAAAWQIQHGVGALSLQLFQAPLHELVHIAVIIGEEDPRLDVAPVGAGVVLKPLERIVHTHRVEERKRQVLSGFVVPDAIGNLIADESQFRGWKMQSQFSGCDAIAPQIIALFQNIGVGDLLIRDVHLDQRPIVARKVFQLFGQITAEVIGVGNCCGIDPRPLELREGAGNPRLEAVGCIADPELRIGGARSSMVRADGS
jgi:hypothetical protein